MILAVLQARMSSTRLPGKVLRPLAGAPSLQRQIERILRCQMIDKVMVATSTRTDDDAIVALSDHLDIATYRGSLENVLDRFYQAAIAYRPDHVVRLTADCPLADWRLIDALIAHHLQGGFDYCSNTCPRRYPKGLDAEVMTFEALERAWRGATTNYQKEHVTPYLYEPKTRHLFSFGSIAQTSDWGALRWTLDTEDDYEMIAGVYECLGRDGQPFTADDTLELLLQRKDLRDINSNEDAENTYKMIQRTRPTLQWEPVRPIQAQPLK